MGFFDFADSSTPAGIVVSGAKGLADGVFNGVDKIIRDFKLPPEQLVAYETRIAELKAQAETASLQYQAAAVTAINTTMQAEAHSEHWLQYSWRPLGAYLFYALLLHNYVTAPYAAKWWGIVQVPVPMEVWYVFLALLGVSAYTRGQVQVEEAKNGKV